MTNQISTRRNIFLWILYDFANSIVLIAFYLYLSQWLVIDGGLSSFWFNSIFVGSTILLIFLAPILGALSDKVGKRKIFLNITTVGAFLFFAGTAIMASIGKEYVWWVAALYLFAQFFYQFSFVFYNPMIEQLAPIERRGRISGLGQTANWIGQIVGVLIALPLAASGRVGPLLPASIIFFILALPMMVFFKETTPEIKNSVTIADTLKETRHFFRHFYLFMKQSSAAVFLIAFFFFNDALLTLSNNFPIFVDKVFHVNDNTKAVIIIAILVTSAIGAYISGWLSDKIGMKKTLKIVLGAWMVIIPIVSVTYSLKLFIAVAVVVGLLYGAIWPVTRAYLSSILPKDQMNYGFSFYTLMERVATFVGPLSWGLIVTSFGENSMTGYRVAAFAMTVFVVIGYWFVRKVPERV